MNIKRTFLVSSMLLVAFFAKSQKTSFGFGYAFGIPVTSTTYSNSPNTNCTIDFTPEHKALFTINIPFNKKLSLTTGFTYAFRRTTQNLYTSRTSQTKEGLLFSFEINRNAAQIPALLNYSLWKESNHSIEIMFGFSFGAYERFPMRSYVTEYFDEQIIQGQWILAFGNWEIKDTYHLNLHLGFNYVFSKNKKRLLEFSLSFEPLLFEKHKIKTAVYFKEPSSENFISETTTNYSTFNFTIRYYIFRKKTTANN